MSTTIRDLAPEDAPMVAGIWRDVVIVEKGLVG
jgi:hypothetical protein